MTSHLWRISYFIIGGSSLVGSIVDTESEFAQMCVSLYTLSKIDGLILYIYG
jgi:hypothetical protein